MRRKSIRGLLLVLVGLSVASCGVLGEKKVYPCPKLYVLADAGSLVRFKPGPGRDITDILFEGRVADFTGTCEYDGKKGVDIDLQVLLELRRGPASNDRAISFEYFVAIPAFRPQPEGKRELPVTDAYGLASHAMVTNLAMDEATEGIAAFLEKRSPNWDQT